MPVPTIAPELIDALARYDSATVQNAGILVRGYVDAAGDYSAPGLDRMVGSEEVVVGYAVTAELTPVSERSETLDWNEYHDLLAYTDAPLIVVLKDVDQPSRRGAIIGDGMAYRFTALGAVGAVVDGNARDVPGIEKAGLHLWATGRVPGHGPFNLVRHSSDVEINDLRISQGDILVCDGDGVTRVVPEAAADIVKACEEVRKRESESHRFFSTPGFSTADYESWKRDR